MNAFQKYAAKRLLVASLIEKLAAPPQVFDFTKKKGEGSTILSGGMSKGRIAADKYMRDSGMQAIFDKFMKSQKRVSKSVFKPHPSLRRPAEAPASPFGRKGLATVKPVKPVVNPANLVSNVKPAVTPSVPVVKPPVVKPPVATR